MTKSLYVLVFLGASLLVAGCSDKKGPGTGEQIPVQTEESSGSTAEIDPMQYKGVGPVTSVELGAIDPAKAAKGKELFDLKCTSCHRMEMKVIGPPLKGVTTRRTPEWIMNMMLNPREMIEKDPVAKQLYEEYMSMMTYQDLTQEDARNVLEYLRQADQAK